MSKLANFLPGKTIVSSYLLGTSLILDELASVHNVSLKVNGADKKKMLEDEGRFCINFGDVTPEGILVEISEYGTKEAPDKKKYGLSSIDSLNELIIKGSFLSPEGYLHTVVFRSGDLLYMEDQAGNTHHVFTQFFYKNYSLLKPEDILKYLPKPKKPASKKKKPAAKVKAKKEEATK